MANLGNHRQHILGGRPGVRLSGFTFESHSLERVTTDKWLGLLPCFLMDKTSDCPPAVPLWRWNDPCTAFNLVAATACCYDDRKEQPQTTYRFSPFSTNYNQILLSKKEIFKKGEEKQEKKDGRNIYFNSHFLLHGGYNSTLFAILF